MPTGKWQNATQNDRAKRVQDSIIARLLSPVIEMKRLLMALVAFYFVVVASACGQSGPLYIPGDPSRIEAPPPAPEEEEEDDSDGR